MFITRWTTCGDLNAKAKALVLPSLVKIFLEHEDEWNIDIGELKHGTKEKDIDYDLEVWSECGSGERDRSTVASGEARPTR